MKKLLLAALTILYIQKGTSQTSTQYFPFKGQWVDSVYNTLSLEEKLGQLFMVAAYSDGPQKNTETIQKLIGKHHIGGLIFMQGTAEAQAKQTNIFQKQSTIPLFIAMDAEWGLGMRLKGVHDLPKQMTIGASNDTTLMYEIGTVIAQQCKRLGVHINFAPTIDINNNPKNPVIGFRSFGENKLLVTQMGRNYMNALQQNNIMACAKHFPGHGDVTIDSHLDLPKIEKSKASLTALELYPFQGLIKNGVQGVMIAHLNLPLIEPQNIPSTLSYTLVTDMLKKEMGFSGLIFTDALNMKGVTKYFAPGEIELKAFMAGNDVLLFSEKPDVAIQKLSYAYKTGNITEERLAHSVKKILGAKYEKGLAKKHIDIDEENVTTDINQAYESVMEKTAMAAITLLKDKTKMLNRLATSSPHYITTFNATDAQIAAYKERFASATIIAFDNNTTKEFITKTLASIPKNKTNLIALHKIARYPGKGETYGYSEVLTKALTTMSIAPNNVFVVYGVPYFSKHFCKANTVIIAYEDQKAFQEQVMNILSGKAYAIGTSPVSTCGN